MKKALFIAALFAAALAVSCKQELNIDDATTEARITRTFNCVLVSEPDSKVSIDAKGKTKWEVGDEILIHAGNDGNEREIYTLAAEDISADGKTAKVATTLPPYIHYDSSSGEQDYTSTYYAVYPASALINPDPESSYPFQNRIMYYETRIEDFSEPVIGACDDGEGNFLFYNVCGVISFSVSGGFDTCVFSGNGEEIVGYNVYQCRIAKKINGDMYLQFPKFGNDIKEADVVSQKSITMSVKGDGTTVHTICIPGGINLANGFTMKFFDGEEIVKVASSTKGVNLKRGTYLNLGDITSHLKDYEEPTSSDHRSAITGAKDLSALQANCYVITAPGAYKLPVLKGNSEESAGSIFGAKVVWETYNNETEVVAGSIIEAVDFDGPDNFIYFKTPETLKPGNAVIAALDNRDRIIWSWHIWIPETTIETVDATAICNAVVMDRNLGALVVTESGGDAVASVESFGLLYQWGRKDPFPGPKRVDSTTLALIAGTPFVLKDQSKEEYVSGDLVKGYMTLAETIQNPTVFGNVGGGDWDETQNPDRWTREGKTKYDPCPKGYMVMKRESSSVLWNTTNIKTAVEEAGMKFTSSVDGHWIRIESETAILSIPAAGYIDDCDTKNVPYIEYPGKRAAVYAAYLSSSNPYHLNIRLDKDDYWKAGSTSAARGASIRCVVE